EHLTLEMLAYGRQKPAYSHFVARIFRKILAEHLTHFIRKLLYCSSRVEAWHAPAAFQIHPSMSRESPEPS
ncbi:hypothetical protein, partial [Desulfovibrio sp.]|uniref:hypothetical protein n=1 Tax=Desulfovibrio sp. TaxID=885 RepID=UPI003D0E1229